MQKKVNFFGRKLPFIALLLKMMSLNILGMMELYYLQICCVVLETVEKIRYLSVSFFRT